MAPVKKLTKKEAGLKQRPWITKDILNSMSERDIFYKAFIKEKNITLRENKYALFKIQRNSVTSELRKSKKDYYGAFFEKHKSNIKETWKGIRDLINVSKKSDININKLIVDGKEIINPREMADSMNNFYVNIGTSIEKKIPKVKMSHCT